MSPEYAQKMINLGFKLVTIGADQRYMSAGAKAAIDKIKLTTEKNLLYKSFISIHLNSILFNFKEAYIGFIPLSVLRFNAKFCIT